METNDMIIKLLTKICPGPIGRGLTIQKAAKELNITHRTARYELEKFKKDYPQAWEEFEKLRNIAKQDRYKLRWKEHPDRQLKLKLFSELLGETKSKGNDNIDYNDYDDYINYKQTF